MARVTVITFGYDVGPVPADCVWVADVRNIPTSELEGLWDKTGLDASVSEKVLATTQAKNWIKKFTNDVLPDLKDGDRIAIGCSIGVHRSVAVAVEITHILRQHGFEARLYNRDLSKRRDTSTNIPVMSKNFEVRAIGDGSVTFTNDGGKPRIDARAIKYDSWSVDLGGFQERMMPGSVLLDGDMVALFDHDTSKVLGRTSAGTMEVRSDSIGVGFTAFPPNTTWASDLKESMARGDIKGCSFRMMVDEDYWYVKDGMVCRDVLKARVSELTVTSMPAYPETTAEARSHAAALAGKVTDVKTEDRAGRVLSDANENAIKMALDCIETASDTLEQVLMQVDPTYVPDQGETDPAGDMEDPTESGPAAGGAPTDMNRSVAGGAPVTKSRVFAQGFGFINIKEK